MRIRNKETGRTFEVYKVRDDAKGYPHFLIYENNQWVYRSAKYFEPCIWSATANGGNDE